jgi:hypothetical protein
LIQRRETSLSPAAERFKEMLLQLWSNDRNSPWVGKFNL